MNQPLNPEGDTNPRGIDTVTDEDSAADYLTGILGQDADAPADEDQQLDAADGAEGETPPSAEDETDQPEAEDPPIEAPVSWNAEEKKLFATLPPQAQQALLRRESEREGALTRASQEAAERKKASDDFLQTAANERAQHVNLLQSIVLQLQPDLARFQNIDWVQLAQENPAQWAALSEQRNQVLGRINAAHTHIQNIQQQNEVANVKATKERLQVEHGRLLAVMPEIAAPEKGRAFTKDIVAYANRYGITEQDIAGIQDHRYFLILRDAMTASRNEEARKAALAKKVPAQGSNVRVLRPAARSEGNEGEGRRLAALRGNLAKTGSIDDTAALLATMGIK